MDEIDSLKQSFDQQLFKTDSLKKLEELKIKYLGRNGEINRIVTRIKNIRPDERKNYGQKLNDLKTSIKRLIEEKYRILSKNTVSGLIDFTLPGKKYPKGSLHPISYAIEEISQIFSNIGFIRMTYPEVEWEYFAFEALNMPKDHPARDDFETFFINFPKDKKFGKMVLTPHTSSGQIREMLRVRKTLSAGMQAPIRMINITKCYRPNWDTTHTPMFHQFEGLCIDKNINITHLKGTIDYFVKSFFGKDRQIRLRPAHFQFTEPSFEIDVTCGVCAGTGSIGHPQGGQNQQAHPKGDLNKCRVCKSGWLELAGAGLVHPDVLKAGGINPEHYSGWAFGFGPERCMMMKDEIKIDDIRILYNGDIRFLEQF